MRTVEEEKLNYDTDEAMGGARVSHCKRGRYPRGSSERLRARFLSMSQRSSIAQFKRTADHPSFRPKGSTLFQYTRWPFNASLKRSMLNPRYNTKQVLKSYVQHCTNILLQVLYNICGSSSFVSPKNLVSLCSIPILVPLACPPMIVPRTAASLAVSLYSLVCQT